MDKGFYSKKNVDCLVEMKQKFTISVPMSNKWVQEAIDDIHQDIHGSSIHVILNSDIFLMICKVCETLYR